MKQAYENFNFRGKSKILLARMQEVMIDYANQGYMLTVRQLFYQMVSRDIIPNTQQSYKNLASLINDGRMAGVLDWDGIEDRTREVTNRPSWVNASSVLDSAAASFHMDLWEGQDDRFVVIVEKEALAGVMQRVCRRLNVHMLAARGYPSVTVLRELALKTLSPWVNSGRSVHILHFGDHDPSGVDMTRDLEKRIEIFMPDGMFNVELKRMALNMDQVEEYDPPPNPAKTTDSRFEDYARIHGDESWELDALEPSVLVSLVEDAVVPYIDKDVWEAREAEIEHWRAKIYAVADDFRIQQGQ